ncbi:MAG: VTT domain-containing protein [Myxococcales bacterium]|nr:VTT domain-containing protein [Myxococcales bacterium]
MHDLIDFLRNLLKSEHQQALIAQFGYPLLAGIVFAETGLLVGFFLPGDSLLFSAGVVAAAGHLNILVLNVLLIAMAILGDAVGYGIGRYFGAKLYEREQTFFFRKDHLIATREFYEKHGGKTIVIARFMPFARTFAPVVAGIAQMPYARFLSYNVFGGIGWVTSMSLLGYFLGQRLGAKNTERMVYLIIVFSLLPVVIGYLRNKKSPATPSA